MGRNADSAALIDLMDLTVEIAGIFALALHVILEFQYFFQGYGIFLFSFRGF